MFFELMIRMTVVALATWVSALATTLGVLTAVLLTVIPLYGIGILFRRKK